MSDFVIREFPESLNSIQAQKLDSNVFSHSVDDLAARQLLRINHLSQKPEDPALLLARLDILMLQAAIVHSGGTVPATLSKIVALIAEATDRPPAIMYEDIVINNREDDIRTFTNGLVGRSEADFYNGHRYIEEALDPAINKLYTILEHPDELSTEQIVELLISVNNAFKATLDFTAIISGRMPREHFVNGFRQYLGEIKEKNLRGPSGAFTARVPLIEFLIAGETISQEDIAYQISELRYFPLPHQAALIDALVRSHEGKSVRQIIIKRGSPVEGMTALKEISELYRRFRNIHLRAVERHLPEVVSTRLNGANSLKKHQN